MNDLKGRSDIKAIFDRRVRKKPLAKVTQITEPTVEIEGDRVTLQMPMTMHGEALTPEILKDAGFVVDGIKPVGVMAQAEPMGLGVTMVMQVLSLDEYNRFKQSNQKAITGEIL